MVREYNSYIDKVVTVECRIMKTTPKKTHPKINVYQEDMQFYKTFVKIRLAC